MLNLLFASLLETEDIEYLMCSDCLSLSFGRPLLVLAPGSPGFLASAVLNRIREFRDLNSVNL